MYESPAARAYEAHAPQTGVPEAQAEERAQRRAFQQEARQHRRTGRTRGIIVPELPWLRDKETAP
jgi:hypothetical protein